MLTPFDEQHAYLRMGADWREVGRIVLNIDPDREPDWARQAFDSHLARAKWMTRYGYRAAVEIGCVGL